MKLIKPLSISISYVHMRFGLTISAQLPLVELSSIDGLSLKLGGFILSSYPAEAFAFEGRFTFKDFPEVKMTMAYMWPIEDRT